MARLYGTLGSDSGINKATRSGNEMIWADLYYGSKSDKKKAISIYLSFEKGAKVPTVHIKIADEVSSI